jgi:hypothetical protein
VILTAGMLIAGASAALAGGGPRGENHCNPATPGDTQCGGHGNH